MADCLGVDCGRAPPAAPLPPRSYAGLDLMARDFDSLLRAMLDRLASLAPEWRDRSEADLGMVLLELCAYAGDQLAYLDDRISLEGFVRTATQHESVKKLLRLVDYEMDPGCAGETRVLFEVSGPAPLFLPRGFRLSTDPKPGAAAVIYETGQDAVLQPGLSRVALAADAPSSADGREIRLAANLDGMLVPGDQLLIQQGEVREWGQVATAAFGATTAVKLAQPLAARYTAAADPQRGGASGAAHGNAVRATHGESHLAQAKGTGLPAQTVEIELAPLTHLPDARGRLAPVLAVLVDGVPWVRVEDFIDSAAADRHYRLSRDNAGFVTVHFGGPDRGAMPAPGADIRIPHRIGMGSAGHVGAGALRRFDERFAFPDAAQKIDRVRNPFAAAGMRDAQPLSDAKLVGPYRLRAQKRAVVPADYEACLAAGVRLDGRVHAPLQSRARFRHTGSWTTVFVCVDMPDRRPLAATPGLKAALEALLETRKMAGLDVRVEDARYCPVHLRLQVEVAEDHFARDVRSSVQAALVGPLAGRLPFFAPGRLAFGEPVYLSDLYAAVAAVEGVRSVAVTRFKRLGDRYPDSEEAGLIPVAALEVARCDNDPAAPENGVLHVATCGGKAG